VKRIIVAGGLGQFGRTAVEELRILGLTCHVASRRASADIQLDVNDRDSIQRTIRPGDVVLDAAGPFHARSAALIECAIEIGFDVIDISDDLTYAESVLALRPRIDAAGVRVLSSASSVSAVAAAVVRSSGIAEPRRVTAFLAPASRRTSNPGAALSLLRSVGQPVRVFRDGRLQIRVGWSEHADFDFPPPLGQKHGRLFESADSVYLPRIWPSLRDVAMYVDTNTPGVNSLLVLAARAPAVRRFLERGAGFGTRVARTIGSAAGGIGYEIASPDGQPTHCSIVGAENSFVTAVAPAVLAVQAIAADEFSNSGLVLPDQHVEPEQLLTFLGSRGIHIES
jgi:hypothetical protein